LAAKQSFYSLRLLTALAHGAGVGQKTYAQRRCPRRHFVSKSFAGDGEESNLK
jgi:hypothetical protein